MKKISKLTAAALSAAVSTGLSGCVVVDGNGLWGGDEPSARERNTPQVIVNQRVYKEKNSSAHRNGLLLKTADGKCLDRSKSNYRGMIAYDCHGEANQRFSFVQDSIRVEGLCLDIAGGSSKAGVKVIAYKCQKSRNQQWFTVGNTIRSKLNGLCLDAQSKGNRVTMQPCDNSAGQQFYSRRGN